MRVIFLIGPAFLRMGVTLIERMRNIALQSGSQLDSVILNTGTRRHEAKLRARLGQEVEILNLFELERHWFGKHPSAPEHHLFNKRFAPGTFGRTLLSDRRLCGGLVTANARRSRLPAHLTHDMREAYVVNMYADFTALIDRVDLVFCYAVAGAPAFAMSEIASERGVPFRQLIPTRISNFVALDSRADGQMGFLAGQPYTEQDHEDAQSYLHEFRDEPVPPEYQRSQNSSGIGSWPRLRRSLVEILHKGVDFGKRPSLERIALFRNQLDRAIEDARAMVDLARLARLSEPLPERYWFFPLHVEPEASTMVLSPWYSNQVSLIETVSKCLPAGYRLLLKEHPSMIGRRSWRYYKALVTIPGVSLCHPDQSSFDLIRSSQLAVTNTGTVALESLMLGRPFAVMGNNYLRTFFPENCFSGNLADLPGFLSSCAAQSPKPDASIIDMIARLFNVSVPIDSSAMWGGRDKKAGFEALDRIARSLFEAGRVRGESERTKESQNSYRISI